MSFFLLLALFLTGRLIPTEVLTQTPDAQQRTQEIIASLNKTKYKVATKRGLTKQLYISVRGEPVISKNLADYSGSYAVLDLGYRLEIRVASNGAIEASGYELSEAGAGQGRRFSLKNARIDGALLTGTKIYDDGSTETFEGVFINLTRVEGVSPTQIERQITSFGLGVAGTRVNAASGVNLDRLFYQRTN